MSAEGMLIDKPLNESARIVIRPTMSPTCLSHTDLTLFGVVPSGLDCWSCCCRLERWWVYWVDWGDG